MAKSVAVESSARGLGQYYESVFEELPCAVFVLNAEMGLVDFNRAAFRIVKEEPSTLAGVLIGEVLSCNNALNSPRGCGSSPACRRCVLRNSAMDTLLTGKRASGMASMELQSGPADFLVATALLDNEADPLVLLTLQPVEAPVLNRAPVHHGCSVCACQ